MTLQVLVSTMHQKDHSILEKMNIQSDAIIVNQGDRNEFEEFDYKGNNIKFLSFNERGVGLSRNNALMRATADICLFADDDVKYVDNYKDIILRAFQENVDADVIVFNVPSTNAEREEYTISKEKRLRFYNCLRYGTVRIAIRTESIRKSNIHFSLLFGGGAKYGSGEDSLFMMDCIKSSLNVHASSKHIGIVTQSESTWFKGYTDKYFIDKGALFAVLSRRWAKLMCIQIIIRHKEFYKGSKSWLDVYKLMSLGIQQIDGVKSTIK
jgi:glycosyltransferase involved in cell wall biosynthesis